MHHNHTKFKQGLSKAISALMIFWLSSVLIFLCCITMSEEVSASEMIPECHQTQKHQTQDTDLKNISKSKKSSFDCCVFKPQKTLATDLQTSKDLKHIQAAEKPVSLEKPVYVAQQNYQPAKVYHSAIRNRGSTYLKNCNFRI